MDFHIHSNPRLHYGLNGSMGPDDGLQYLSVEEKECILFFEETIDSLQEGLEEDCVGLSSGTVPSTGRVRTSATSSTTAISNSLMDHDIIDLVHSPPQFTMPDFPSQAHFERKPTSDVMDFPNAALSSQSAEVSEESNHHPPPGSVPTPVVVATRLAEHPGTAAPASLPSVLLQRRCSLETQRSPSPKCGPPTHAKPARLPDNISVTRGNREPNPHSIAMEAVSMQERRSQMLANLPTSVHPLEGGEPDCVRNIPTRSVSFADRAQSRIEALTKLGLTGGSLVAPPISGVAAASKVENNGSSGSGSAISGGINKVGRSADIASSSAHTSFTPASNNPDTSASLKNSNASATHSGPSGSHEPKVKSEIGASNSNSYGGRSAVITAATPHGTGNHDKKSSAPLSAVSAEVSHSDFNSYGGKTIMLNPTVGSKCETVPPRSSPAAKQKPADVPLNGYGFRSKVITPSSTHSDHSPNNTLTSRPNHCNLDSPTGSRSIVFQHEAQSLLNTPEAKPLHPDRLSQPIVRARSSTVPSTPAPRPPRSTAPPSVQRPSGPPEVHRGTMLAPKSSLRTQGITVQFSGKGTSEEDRRDALRKLGLLRNAP